MRLRGALVLVGVLAAVVACSGETVPAPTSTEPAGALYGSVRTTDGEPVTDADVRLHQTSVEDVVNTGVAIMSLGIFCLAPDICDAPVRAELSSQGFYVFPERVLESTPFFTVAATAPDDPDGLAGARTSVSLADGQNPQRAPDLTLWEPEIDVDRHGHQATLRWSSLERPAHGSDVAYTLWVRDFDRTSRAKRVTGSITGTSATLDLRPYEDQPTEVTVVAGTKASVDDAEVTLAYQSPGRELPVAGAPPSRDRPCLTDDAAGKASGQLVPFRGPCSVTDGLYDHEALVAEEDCRFERDGALRVEKCKSVTHRKICVDLGARGRASLVVVRAAFVLRGSDLLVELSEDGRSFSSLGRGKPGQYPIVLPVEPARSVELVCVRGKVDNNVEELSVWP